MKKFTTDYEDIEIVENYEKKVEAHWFVMYPVILNEIGNLKGKKILDIGCGNGEFTAKMAELGAEVTGIDNSKEWIRKCNSRFKMNNLHFIMMDAEKMNELNTNTFDYVIANMVFLNVPTEEKLLRVFSEINRVLNKNGELIFSDLHPICKLTQNFPNRKTSLAKDFSYFKMADDFEATVFFNDKTKINFHNKNWNLQHFSEMISKSGMYISKIIEPTYVDDSPPEFKEYKVPEYIYFCCRKLIK